MTATQPDASKDIIGRKKVAVKNKTLYMTDNEANEQMNKNYTKNRMEKEHTGERYKERR